MTIGCSGEGVGASEMDGRVEFGDDAGDALCRADTGVEAARRLLQHCDQVRDPAVERTATVRVPWVVQQVHAARSDALQGRKVK